MKGVKIAALKKQLSKHLRAVERGAEIEVTDEWGRITRPLSSERTASRWIGPQPGKKPMQLAKR